MTDQQNPSAFSFETMTGQEAVLEITQQSMPPAASDDQLRMAVEASGIATYHWNIDSDTITWSSNAIDVLGSDPRGFATGRGFASYLDPDNFTSRYDTVMRNSLSDDGAGVAFQIEYKFRPEGRAGRGSVWLEDHGRWFAGSDGRPAEVMGTVRRIDDRHMRDQHLSFLGNCDPLTGMMNRGRMMEALGGAMSVAGRDGTNCAFVIAAINNLSVVNDAYGFEVADEVIINMGRRLRQVVRTGDAIARYSGSKFGLILNNCGEDDLIIAAERFLSVARESVIETERGPVWALLSIGCLILPKHAADPNTAVARAEEALSEARKLPSDGYVIYKPSQQRSSERTLNAHSATEIVRCLREDRFRLAFQPVVDAATGKPVFHEALLRMMDSTGEMIAAAHLIPIAEKLGLVRLIDRAVVQMTVAALNKFPDARLSFNISGTTATDPRWYPQIIEILGLEPQRDQPVDRRDHRDRGAGRPARNHPLRRAAARTGLRRGDRRFRRRLHLVPQPARHACRRPETRWHLLQQSVRQPRQPVLRPLADRSGPHLQDPHRGRMGGDRSRRRPAARLGRRPDAGQPVWRSPLDPPWPAAANVPSFDPERRRSLRAAVRNDWETETFAGERRGGRDLADVEPAASAAGCRA